MAETEIVVSKATTPNLWGGEQMEATASKDLQLLKKEETLEAAVKKAVDFAHHGCYLVKVRPKNKRCRRNFFVDEGGLVLKYKGSRKIQSWRKLIKKWPDMSEIYIGQINEVREGIESDTFTNLHKKKLIQADRCFILLIGDSGATLDLIADTPQERDMWVTALRYHKNQMESADMVDPLAANNKRLKAAYNIIDKNKDGKLSVEELVACLQDLNSSIDHQTAISLCRNAKAKVNGGDQAGEDSRHILVSKEGLDSFSVYFDRLLNMPQV